MGYSSYLVCALVLSVSFLCYAQQETCPIEGSPVIPHWNCSLYIQCDNGQEVIQTCPGGTYYNPAEEICDFPGNVPECVDGTNRPPDATTPQMTTSTTTEEPTTTTTTEEPTTTTTTEEPTTIITTEPTTTTTTEEPTTTTTANPNGCPISGVGLIPHPERCEKYYYCLDGEIIEEGECADGLYFDPIEQNCNFPEFVDCVNPTEPPTTTQAPLPECPGSGIISMPYPGNCSLYLLCVEGRQILSQCANGTLFDIDHLQCMPSDEARCAERGPGPIILLPERSAPLFCPLNVEFTKMPMANNCHQWYECRDGHHVDTSPRTCPLGLYFYHGDQACVSFIPEHCRNHKM